MLVSIYSLPVIMKLKSIFSFINLWISYEAATSITSRYATKIERKKMASQSPKEEAARKTTFGIVYNFILFWIRFHQLKRNDHYLTQNFRTCNHLFRTSFSYENSVCIPFSVSMKIHNAQAVQIQNSTEQIPITNVCIQTFKSKP